MYSQQQFTALLNEDIDVGYIRVTPGTTRDGLNIRVLRHDQLCVVLPDDHPKAACETLTITDVKDEPFIFYPDTAGASVPDKVRRMCQKSGFTPYVVQEAAEVLTHIGLVGAGVGVSVLPRPIDQLKPKGVKFIPLAEDDAELCMAIVTRESENNPRTLNFLRLLTGVNAGKLPG